MGEPIAVSDLDSSFKNGILRSRMGAAAARSGAPCVPTATPGPWDIPPAIGDAWFIHYPIYTGCVAARLETRSAAQRAVRRPQNRSEDGRGDTRSGDSPAKGTRSPARTTGSTGGSRGGGPGRSARIPRGRRRAARAQLCWYTARVVTQPRRTGGAVREARAISCFKAGSGHSKGIPLRIPSVPPS